MPSTAEIDHQIERFHLDVKGFQAFPIYTIYTPDFSRHIFRAGKGSPEELQGEVDRIIAASANVGEEINVRDVSSARNLLNRNLIGTDCSNLVYHIADGIVGTRADGTTIQDQLFLSKEDVLKNARDKESWWSKHILSSQEAEKLRPMVPLSWVTETFDKDPQFQVNAARLENDAASEVVPSVGELQPGDLIIMRRKGVFKHVAMATAVNGSEIEIVDSYRTDREDEGYGGVMKHDITVFDSNKPIQEQGWENYKTARYDRYDLRRLRAFAA